MEKLNISLSLTSDGSNRINFEDTYEGLENPWYCFETSENGDIKLWANPDGFEHLGRYFLKLARSGKLEGFHSHHSTDLNRGDDESGPELIVGVCSSPS